MKLAMIAVVVTMLTTPAMAERCEQGLAAAKAGDLQRAALYLEGCPGDEAEKAQSEVAKKLRASQLSALSVVADHEIMFETDAMPGASLTTPATIWLKAGTYKVWAGGVESVTTLPAHSRATVVLRVAKPAAAATNGTVNFNDEPTDPSIDGPPPAVKHKSIMPCKFTGCDTHSGEVLADPLAEGVESIHAEPPVFRVGARIGVAGSERIAPSFAALAQWGWFTLRVDGSPRERDAVKFDELGVSFGISHVVMAPDAAWISLGLALRGDVRPNAPMGTAGAGLGATGELELALRQLPVTFGARYEQGFAGEHAVVVEVGFDWRRFH